MNRIFFHFFLIIGCLLVFPVKAQKMYQWEIYPSYHNSLYLLWSIGGQDIITIQALVGEVA